MIKGEYKMTNQYKLIGQRITDLREIAELSQQEVADFLNISLDTYKSYEDGVEDMPISILYELANKFNVDFTAILSGDAPKLSTYQFVKSGHGLKIDRSSQYTYQSLAPNFAKKTVEPFLVTVPVPKDEDSIHLTCHPGQEFNYVLEGRVCIIINGKEFIMEPGDSLIFDSQAWHGMKALDGKEAKFLAIVSD